MKDLMLAGLESALDLQLHELLGEQYHIHTCTCGTEVLHEFMALLPELLVIDLSMPGCDTIGLLRAVQARGGQTQVLVIACSYHNHIKKLLSMVHTAFLLIHPFDAAAITARLMQLEQLLPPPGTALVRQKADEILRNMGFDCQHTGFMCLLTAICYAYEYPDCLYSGDLCVHTAKCCGGTAASVDKAMIRCIRKAHRRADLTLWSVYLGDSLSGITSARFIHNIAQYLKSVE